MAPCQRKEKTIKPALSSTRCVRNALLILALLCCSTLSYSAPVELRERALPEEPLHTVVHYLEDPSTELTLEQILQGNRQWQKNQQGAFNKGYSNSAWWLRLSIHNPQSSSASRLLELSYAILDYVDVYVVSDGKVLESYHTGDQRPYATRPMNHRFYVLPLTWQPGQTLDIYYRLQSTSSVQAPITLWSPDTFHEYDARSNLFQGLYYGAMAIMLVYNLLVFIVLWDRSYLYYVGFIASGPLFFLALSGQGYHYLWTDQEWWNAHSVAVFVSSLILFGALFTRRFIGLRKVSLRLDRLIMSFAVIGAVMLVLSFLLPYKVMITLLVPLAMLACLADFLAGGVAWYRGVSSARFYVVAWAFFLTGTIVMALQKINILPTNPWTEYAVQFGSALEAVLLSFAMADRISSERRLRIDAQEETLRTTIRLNEELEHKVEERTEQLSAVNEQLKQLSVTDQLTGLHNRRYLEEAGDNEWSRCARYGHQLSVLIMDVDYFKQVNDRYGHLAGDRCLWQIGQSLKKIIRSSVDIIARYGGEEFCLILPETDNDGALCVAERIRRDIEHSTIEFDGERFTVTVSIGLYTTNPGYGGSMEMALKMADQGLYQAKEGGRNQVVSVQDT